MSCGACALVSPPYQEGLTMEEAGHELVMATGIYGKPCRQNGAPLACGARKYGFKSIKSVVAIDFVEQRPTTFWEAIAANDILGQRQPRSRSTLVAGVGKGAERRKRCPQLFNGYAEEVAGLYAGLDAQSERLFM